MAVCLPLIVPDSVWDAWSNIPVFATEFRRAANKPDEVPVYSLLSSLIFIPLFILLIAISRFNVRDISGIQT